VKTEPRLWKGDPKRLGRYRVVHRLASGGMGIVYLAQDPRGRFVAVKVLRPELIDDQAFMARFRREVEAARRVQSDYTASVIDFAVETKPPYLGSRREPRRMYLVTEFVAGPTLEGYVKRIGPLDDRALKALALSLGKALASIHAVGLVHRDLKPSNVILGPDGPRVIDFGIVAALEETSITETGLPIGSPGWMAPEQLKGEHVTAAADIFAWGLVMAFAATGRMAFGEGIPDEVSLRILHRMPDLSGLHEELLPLVTASLNKSGPSRPTAHQLVDRLNPQPGIGLSRDPETWENANRVEASRRVEVPAERSADDGDRDGRGRLVFKASIAFVALAFIGVFFAASHRRDVVSDRPRGGTSSPSPNPALGEPLATSLIAFTRTGVLYSMKPDGTGVRLLRPVRNNPALSPDGKKILYVRDEGGYGVGVVDSDGSNDSFLIPAEQWCVPSHPTWSPDGRAIAFGGCSPHGSAIYTSKADGTGVSRLTQEGWCSDPAWSLGGDQIAFSCTADVTGFYKWVRGNGVYRDPLHIWKDGTFTWNSITGRVSLNGGHVVFNCECEGNILAALKGASLFLTLPCDDFNCPPPSPSVVFERESSSLSSPSITSSGIVVMGRNGGSSRALTSPPDGVQDLEPAWSPDGKKLSFVRSTLSSEGAEEDTIWIINADGSQGRELALGEHPAWSGDGSLIFFDRPDRTDPEHFTIYSMKEEGGRAKALSPGEEPALCIGCRLAAYPEPITLQAEGLGIANFGDDADQVIRSVNSLLGNPDDDGGWQPAGDFGLTGPTGVRVRRVAWSKLRLTFADYQGGHEFVAWHSTDPLFATPEGIGIGSSVASLKANYPKATFWDDRGYHGFTLIPGWHSFIGYLSGGVANKQSSAISPREHVVVLEASNSLLTKTEPVQTSASKITLGPFGLGIISFGDEAEKTVRSVTALLGSPEQDTGWKPPPQVGFLDRAGVQARLMKNLRGEPSLRHPERM
jgi:serine/threonine protein kinase